MARNIFMFVFAVALLASLGGADAVVVWHIGHVDNNYAEFACAGNYNAFAQRFPRDVLYRVGASAPEKDWPFIHPGPADDWAGSKPHAFKIKFTLLSVPEGELTLKIKTVDVQPVAPPTLEVDVNGAWSKTVKCPPGSDQHTSLVDPKTGKQSVIMVSFKSEVLIQGRNVITIATKEGSWLSYDAISLECGAAALPEIATLAAECTPMFKKVGGASRQAVRLDITNNGVEGAAEAWIDGVDNSRQKIALSQGLNTVLLLAPPFEKVEAGCVRVLVGKVEKKADFEGRPAKQWKIYVAPSAHTDIGYTDLQEKIFTRHNDNTAAALKACAANSLFKWNLEVSAQVRWLQNNDPAQAAELRARIKEGRIGLTGLYLNMLTGICSGEEMVQALSYSQELGRELGVPVRTATLTDVPSAVGTLPMLLNHAGVHHFVEGVNVDRGPVFTSMDKKMIQSPFWWEGLDGSRVLTLFTRQYSQANQIGLVNDTAAMARMLPNWIKNVERPDYPGDAMYVNGAYSDNCALDAHYADVASQWNAEWDFPKIIIATTDEFFDYVEQNFAKDIPVFRGDMGVYWEDGAASSAFETALVRWAKPKMAAAERWHALAATLGPIAYPTAEMNDAWDNILFYDEHTWGASSSISDPKCEQTVKQWAWKAAYATKAVKKSTTLCDSGREELLSVLRGGKKTGAKGVVAMNEQSWARDMPVSVTLPDEKPVHVRNGASGKTVASQQKGTSLVFMAKDVPALGYRSYTIERGAVKPGEALLKAGASPDSWETARFRLRINAKTGGIASLEDKKLHREWVDGSSGYDLNQYVYVTGGEGTSMIHPDTKQVASLQQASFTSATVELIENGPLRAMLYIKCADIGDTTADTWIIFTGEDQIDFGNVVNKPETTAKEAGYFAFPIRLDAPDKTRTLLELPYGIVEADKEQLPGADREWYSTNSFIGVTDSQCTALIATPHAPMVTVGNINRGLWPDKVDNNRGTVFAYVFNNYWHTNYKASQGGPLMFGFSLKFSPGDFDPVAATKFGWEQVANINGPIYSPPGLTSLTDLPAKPEGSLLHLDGNVVLGGLSRHDGALLARLYNPTSAPQDATLALTGRRIMGAAQTDLFGANGKAVSEPMPAKALKVTVPARGLMTLKLETKAM